MAGIATGQSIHFPTPLSTQELFPFFWSHGGSLKGPFQQALIQLDVWMFRLHKVPSGNWSVSALEATGLQAKEGFLDRLGDVYLELLSQSKEPQDTLILEKYTPTVIRDSLKMMITYEKNENIVYYSYHPLIYCKSRYSTFMEWLWGK